MYHAKKSRPRHSFTFGIVYAEDICEKGNAVRLTYIVGSLLFPPLPLHDRRAKRPGEQTRVISSNNTLDALGVVELQIANDGGEDGLQLHVGELLANAAMPASTEGQVRRCGALADNAVAVILGLLDDALLDVLGRKADVLLGGSLVPSVGLPLQRLGEVLGSTAGDTGRGEEDVGGGNDEVGSLNRHRVLDHAHNAVNRGVNAKSLLDDLGVQRKAAEVLVVEVLEGTVGVNAKNLLLFLEKIVLNVGARCETEQDPADGSGGAVLAGHKESNHHVSNLTVRDRSAVLVMAVHQVPNHILLSFSRSRLSRLTPFLDDIGVHFRHLALCSVASAVMRQRQPAELEVDRDEATVKIVVEVCESSVKSFANLPALKRARSGVDGELGESWREVDRAMVRGEALRGRVLGEEIDCLASNELDVGAERGGGEAELDKL